MGIEIFNNFLNEELYKTVFDASNNVLKSGGNQFTTNRYWDYGIVKDSAPVLVHNINQASALYKNLKKQIESKTEMELFEGGLMIYFWTRYSYIPWHNDKQYDGAITIYLNEKWHPDNGGYFLYSEQEDGIPSVLTENVDGRVVDYDTINNIRAIIPRKNLAILQKNKVHHCTTPVNFFGDLRITVQAFLQNRSEQKETKQ